ncbi:energy-coupling factor transporter transmembrane protein EcfT [Rubrobacter tropicus]|uniref:Energy-coupling factor transporter transmembrane protein EcfT n=1 Tax=Rubrobacter tropicus TaxID=2653851 RepID=A0A6G8Q6A0_9ACTN|nr:energy-coupling factor transporter transmembrane component T [Rubrobacter tropicus]QIN81847.1 energy-coupling factor transporter transmembrane protein EcfT [Rubrobacter tropicus]
MLELQRNVIFGQYVDTGSFVHRMDARVKLVITFIFIVASFFVDDFLGFGLAFLLLGVFQVSSRIPAGYLLRGSAFFFGFLLFILVFQVLFYPGESSGYLWRWGILSVSTEGLYAAGILGLRVVFLYYVTTMLMLTTSLVDLTNGLELLFRPLQRLRLPVNELVLVFVIAIKFVPIFIEEVERLARAQTARGVPFDEGGAVTRARRIGRLLVPIFISGFARADTLTTAMNTRSYRGGQNRTKFRVMKATAGDWAILVLVTAWMVAAWTL